MSMTTHRFTFSDEEEQDLGKAFLCGVREQYGHSYGDLAKYSSGSEKGLSGGADDFYDKKYPKEPNGVCFLIDMGQRQIVWCNVRHYAVLCRTRKSTEHPAGSAGWRGDYTGTFAK